MEYAALFLFLALCCAVGGALVYRNNSKKIETAAAQLQKEYNDLKSKYDQLTGEA